MYLRGVGPQRAKILAAIGIETLEDLLYYYPRRYLDRTGIKAIRDLRVGDEAVVIGRVEKTATIPTRRKVIFTLTLSDDTGRLTCQWFHGISWISDKFTIGDTVAVFGKVDFYNGLKLTHPDFDILEPGEDPVNTGKILAQYPSTAELKAVGLTGSGFRKIIATALERLDEPVPDHFPPLFLQHYGLMPLDTALRVIHQPRTLEDLQPATFRLKFDEHFFIQLLMALRRKARQDDQGRVFLKKGPFVKRMYEKLPFQLTKAQINVLREIHADLKSAHQMNRLLQGDVGSGKTVVAMLTAATVIGNGAQVAVMAPTEILADQHYRSFREYCELVGIRSALLKGGMKTTDRANVLEPLATGELQLVVGTHALIQEDVKFKDLGLVIVDEQHRFGVLQRKELMQKGLNPELLAMTATPIPRTLAITYHGDLDISVIDELPAGRLPVKTTVVEPKRLEKVYSFMRSEMAAGRQCFVIYPIIEESEKLDLEAADLGYLFLKDKIFPEFKVGYIHGKMKPPERDRQMKAFESNELQLLVATTVVEVGIDIPNASVMVIENAERFGLSQLHQLRGRIGRGSYQSHCVLVQRKETEDARYRLEVMESTNDGFIISDRDLKLRGPGEFFGKKQHGYMKTRLANFIEDGPIIRTARQAAFTLVGNDPNLQNPEHQLLRQHFTEHYKTMLEFVKIG
ncbi:MAG: ATP-dependent DNA helicase RecG [FCB group bacterium]|nr:ATP-dependent DNA helicase RecG [FCB group bacterium]